MIKTFPLRCDAAAFGGGCFWCTEAVFKMLKGVSAVVPGYAGGTEPDPTYENVSSGRSGHAEVVCIEYDPNVIGYRDLLTVFFASHDPTTVNRQGNDVGPQYRSVILVASDEQRRDAEAMVTQIDASSREGNKVVTEIAPLGDFFPAESYHLDYYATHRGAPYCRLVISPKVEKVQSEFAELLKTHAK